MALGTEASRTKVLSKSAKKLYGGSKSGVNLDVPKDSTKGGKSVKGKIAMEEVKVEKDRMTVHIPANLINDVKNSVYWTPGMTLAELAETAFSNELKRMEKNYGKPFPQRGAELKTGRPIKV